MNSLFGSASAVDQGVFDLIYFGDRFVAVGGDGSVATIIESRTNGRTWTPVSGCVMNGGARGLCHDGNGTLLVVGNHLSSSKACLASNFDLTQWSIVTLGFSFSSLDTCAYMANAVIGPRWVLGGEGNPAGIISTSSNLTLGFTGLVTPFLSRVRSVTARPPPTVGQAPSGTSSTDFIVIGAGQATTATLFRTNLVLLNQSRIVVSTATPSFVNGTLTIIGSTLVLSNVQSGTFVVLNTVGSILGTFENSVATAADPSQCAMVSNIKYLFIFLRVRALFCVLQTQQLRLKLSECDNHT